MSDFETVRAAVERDEPISLPRREEDARAALDRIEAEVERLRAVLESAPRGVGDDGPWLDWWRQVSAALAKEEA